MQVTQDDLPLDRVYRWERERTDRIFLTQPFGGGRLREWTWRQAVEEARRVAAYLQSQNWEPESRIAILSRNCAWWVLSDIAIWMAGHISVPVYPSLRTQSIRQILEHSGAKACFVGPLDAGADASWAPPGLVRIPFPNAESVGENGWEALIERYAPIAECPTRPADAVATIIYTSGTTGTPKGVMHCFGGLAHNAMALADVLDLYDEQRALSYLPLAHILERAGVEATALRYGWHLFFTEGIDTFLADLQRARPTLFLSVPRLLSKFQQGVFEHISRQKLDRLLRIPIVNRFVRRRVLRGLGLNSARYVACGGAPLPIDMLRWYRSLGLELMEGYGMSETMITHLPKPGTVRPGYVGAALAGVENRVGEQGELMIRSPMNMLGYYREPRMTAEAFTRDGFFKTGDLVEIAADGQIKIVGRIKEQFKTSKGKYISPAPIEIRLHAHPAVDSCCLMGSGLASPVALVILSEAARAKAADADGRQMVEDELIALMDAINAQLDPFERLSMIVIGQGPWSVANGLLTPTLKLRRSLLEAQYQSRIGEWKEQNRRVVWESSVGQTLAG